MSPGEGRKRAREGDERKEADVMNKMRKRRRTGVRYNVQAERRRWEDDGEGWKARSSGSCSAGRLLLLLPPPGP